MRSRVRPSNIVHHQAGDSDKAQVLARVPTWRQKSDFCTDVGGDRHHVVK